uniref:Putative replicase n=1 Tax=Witsystermes virus TaxID=2796641 RepID=A0A7T7GUY2_9VIRU|nr:putative replicase [Witsystermes virus]
MEKIPSQLSSVIDSNSGLLSYLTQLVRGRKATPRSWLYEQVPAQKVLDDWLAILKGLESGSAFEKRALEFDLKQVNKWGPQGSVPPLDEAIKVVEPAYLPGLPTPGFQSTHWESAKQLARSQLFLPRTSLRPASLENVVDDMRMRDVLSTNSGWPLFQERRKPEVISHSRESAASGAWQDFPAILLFRHYFGKVRHVWMFPMATNLVEGSFTQPLMKAMRSKGGNFLNPWEGFSAVQNTMTEWYRLPAAYVYGGDFTGMDEHMKVLQMHEVFDVVSPIFVESARELLWLSMKNACMIGTVTGPDSWLPPQEHGLASGTGWTQISETIFQKIVYNYLRLEYGWPVDEMAIGDDSASLAPSKAWPVKDKLIQVFEQIGMEANADKQADTVAETTFLQRLFQRGYTNPAGQIRAVYPTLRALETSVYPERWHSRGWSSDMFCVRQYMILENCIDHPLFEEFVRYVVRGQKDLIPFAKLSARQLMKIRSEANLVPNLNPTYNQEKRDSSLADFESIRIAKSM